MSSAFNLADPKPGEPRLRLPGYDKATNDQDWQNAHEGAIYLGMGAAQHIRNLVTHDVTELPEQEALEMLATLSFVARLVDRAQVEKAVYPPRSAAERAAPARAAPPGMAWE